MKPYFNALEHLEEFDIKPGYGLPLDKRIKRAVLILRASGIETFESCQGGEGHAMPEPTIRFYGNAYEGHKAFAIARTYGLPVMSVRHTYDVTDDRLTGPWWEMTFREMDAYEAPKRKIVRGR